MQNCPSGSHPPIVKDVREFLVSASHLFLGAECAACGAPGWGACALCAEALASSIPTWVERPGLVVPLVAANDYRPLVEKLIPVFKDDGGLHLTGLLSRRLAIAVGCLQPPGTGCLVPVPSLPAAVRRRGIDHAALLAARAARLLGLEWRPLLKRRATGLDQRELGAVGRHHNVAASMAATACTIPVILIDDVCTTGASLIEASRALAASGISVLGAAVVGDADREFVHGSAPFIPAVPGVE